MPRRSASTDGGSARRPDESFAEAALFADSVTRTVSERGTLKDLASELGLAPENLYRELNTRHSF